MDNQPISPCPSAEATQAPPARRIQLPDHPTPEEVREAAIWLAARQRRASSASNNTPQSDPVEAMLFIWEEADEATRAEIREFLRNAQ
jgi:hypothetical protein